MKQSNLLITDLKRAVFSWRFMLSSFGVCMMMLAAVPGLLGDRNNSSVFYLLGLSISGSGMASIILCILPVFAFAISFASEWEEKAVSFWIIRTGVVRYTNSKIIVSAISGFCIIAVGMILFILVLHVNLPLFTNATTDLSYEMLLEQGHWYIGLLLYVIHYALSGAIIAVCAMWISFYMPNRFVAAAAPVVLHFTLLRLTSSINLPAWINPIYWIEGIYSTSSPVTTLLVKLATVMVLCSVLGVASVRQMMRRFRNA